MKTTITLLLVLVIGGFAFASTDSITDAQLDSKAAAGDVLGIHHISLADGVDAESFETFVKEEFEPIINGSIPGIPIMVMKGERNADGGEYLLVYDVQNLFVRDFYWPNSGESSDEFQAVMDACGEKCSNAWSKFFEMAVRGDWTDWVQIVN